VSAKKPRLVPVSPRPQEDADVRNPPADFGDAESMRVLDAVFDALIEPLAIQAARDDERARLRGPS
jgi:hypothetical protein